MSPPPNKIQQRSQGQDNKGVMLEKHMCCMNHPVGYAVFISVTLWYPPFSSHGEHVLCPVHFQVKSGSDHTEHRHNLVSHWSRTEPSLSSSFQKYITHKWDNMCPLGQTSENFILWLQICTSIDGLMIFFLPVDEALGVSVSPTCLISVVRVAWNQN